MATTTETSAALTFSANGGIKRTIKVKDAVKSYMTTENLTNVTEAAKNVLYADGEIDTLQSATFSTTVTEDIEF